MFTQSINSQLVTGGGKIQFKLSQINAYIRRYWKVNPSNLSQHQRIIVISYLCFECGLTQTQAAQFLHISLRTAQRDHSNATLFYNRPNALTRQVRKLKGFVEYYQNYCTRYE